MIRIAQLTKYGPLAASTRQRFLQYNSFLSEVGCQTELCPLLDDEYLKDLYSNGKRNLVHVGKRYLGRFKTIATGNYDLLWVHCELFPYVPGFLESLIQHSRRPIVFDYDDAIFHNYDQHRNIIFRKVLGRKLSGVLSVASVTFAGNQYLAEYANAYCDNVRIVPTVLDTSSFAPKEPSYRSRSANIGWIGTPSTWTEFLRPMIPLLLDVVGQEGGRVVAVGAGRIAPSHPLFDSLPWSEETEIALIQRMDIGIMPLTDTPWARGKCGYKLIQYMACGLPVVASPVGVNAEIVEHGVNGFLASTEDEWREALVTLLRDPDLRQKMGAAGRQKVEREFSLQVWGPRVATMLRDVAEKKNS